VHFLLDGNETIGWKPAEECTLEATAYNQEKDFMLYGDRPSVWLPMKPGSFAVFFPADAHAPMVSEEAVRKLVFKIAIAPATAG